MEIESNEDGPMCLIFNRLRNIYLLAWISNLMKKSLFLRDLSLTQARKCIGAKTYKWINIYDDINLKIYTFKKNQEIICWCPVLFFRVALCIIISKSKIILPFEKSYNFKITFPKIFPFQPFSHFKNLFECQLKEQWTSWNTSNSNEILSEPLIIW